MKLVLSFLLSWILPTMLSAQEKAPLTLKGEMDYWTLARDWSEAKRYHQINQSEAKALYAVTDGAHGVFPWIKTQW